MSELTKPTFGAAALASIESPLAGVNPRSLDALMAEDVAKLTDPEFDRICLELRRQRQVWEANDQAKARQLEAGKEAKAKGASRVPKAKGTISVDLDDIF